MNIISDVKTGILYIVYIEEREKRNFKYDVLRNICYFAQKSVHSKKRLSKTINKRAESKNLSQPQRSIDGFVKKQSKYLYILHTNFFADVTSRQKQQKNITQKLQNQISD